MGNPVVKQTATSALNFMTGLQNEAETAFSGNQAALDSISSAWGNVLAGGAIPSGFSPTLDKLLQSQIVNQGAVSTANATNAAALQQKQQSGGANVLPTGASQAIDAQIASAGRASTNANLTNEKIADEQQGLTNLEGATNAELGVASGENEVGLSGAATGSGALASNAGNTEFQENQQTGGPGAILGNIGAAANDASSIFG